MNKKNCFNFDITSKNIIPTQFSSKDIIPSQFGNTSRDNFLKYQLDNEVGASLEIEKIGINFILRLKTINGKVLSEVDLSTSEGSIYVSGYYFNGKFYTDPTYQTEIPGDINKIYIDNNSMMFYCYRGISFIPFVPDASDIFPGVVKLYNEPGQNEDGAMTQKVITDGVNSISLKLEEGEEETLLLDLPWD